MKRQFLQSASATVLATVFSIAAVSSPAMATPPSPLYNWTGFYVGGNVGYSWGQGAVQYNEPALGGSGLPTSISGANQLNGGIGGFQAGYNWQLNNLWVAGLETDFQFSSERASQPFSFPYNDGEGTSTLSGRLSSKINWFGTVRGRLGYLINPTTFVYGTGGLAYGQVSASGNFSDSGCTPACTWSFSQTANRVGWALGAGFEGAMPTSRNWTWKVEYLHIDLGTLSGTGFDNDFSGPYSWSAKFTDDILRVGLNYRIP